MRTFTRAQLQDVIRYKRDGTLPANILQTSLVNQWKYKQVMDHLTVKDGTVYTENATKIVVPIEDNIAYLTNFIKDPQTLVLSRDRLYARICQSYYGITRDVCFDFLKNLELYQLHKKVIKEKSIKPIVSSYPFERLQIDLVDLKSLSGYNGGKKYLLNVIDTFSKYAWSFPLTSKKANIVADKMRQVLTELKDKGYNVSVVQSDNGKEFLGLSEVLKEYDSKQVFSSTYTPQANGIVERFNGTLKRMIYSYFTQNKTKRYIDVLPTLVKNYNNTSHSATKKKPSSFFIKTNMDPTTRSAHDQSIEEAHNNIAHKARVKLAGTSALSKGDYVRVALVKQDSTKRRAELSGIGPEAKAHTQQWSKEIYVIWSVSKPKDEFHLPEYTLYQINASGEATIRVEARFQRWQLQKIDRDNIIKLNKTRSISMPTLTKLVPKPPTKQVAQPIPREAQHINRRWTTESTKRTAKAPKRLDL